MTKEPRRYVVLKTRGLYEVRVVGVYHSFKEAEGDARAWDGLDGWSAVVEPVCDKAKETPP